MGWGVADSCQKAKDVLSYLIMVSPVKGLPFTIYFTSTDKSLSALLAQDVEGVERPVYYLSRSLWAAELNYPSIECHCLALVFATQKLRYYLFTHSFNFIITFNPLDISSLDQQCRDASPDGSSNLKTSTSPLSLSRGWEAKACQIY